MPQEKKFSATQSDVEKLQGKVETFETDFAQVVGDFNKFPNKINSMKKDFENFQSKFKDLYKLLSGLFEKKTQKKK